MFGNLGPKRQWLFSAIYASPHHQLRRLLWSYLSPIGANLNTLWLLMGDFNQVTSPHDKKGGRAPIRSHMQHIQDFIDQCGFVDMGFVGSKFTWSNMRKGSDNIQGRLGRCLCNPLWVQLYPDVLVSHLTKTKLDHCLIFLPLG